MRLAIKQALSAPHDKWKIGAVLVRGGSLLSTGFNRYRNDPALVQLEDVSYHAEAVVLSKASDPRGSTIYIARVAKSGVLAMAKPCTRCQELLLENGVGTVLYTTSAGVEKLRSRYARDTGWTTGLTNAQLRE